jgi:hypothetical protein
MMVIVDELNGRPRGLVVDMQIIFHRKKGGLAFDASRLAFRRIFPMDGYVFGLAVQVRALEIIGSQSAHSFANPAPC